MFKNSLQFHDRSFRHVVLPPPSASNITITSAALRKQPFGSKKKIFGLKYGVHVGFGGSGGKGCQGSLGFPSCGKWGRIKGLSVNYVSQHSLIFCSNSGNPSKRNVFNSFLNSTTSSFIRILRGNRFQSFGPTLPKRLAP